MVVFAIPAIAYVAAGLGLTVSGALIALDRAVSN